MSCILQRMDDTLWICLNITKSFSPDTENFAKTFKLNCTLRFIRKKIKLNKLENHDIKCQYWEFLTPGVVSDAELVFAVSNKVNIHVSFNALKTLKMELHFHLVFCFQICW